MTGLDTEALTAAPSIDWSRELKEWPQIEGGEAVTSIVLIGAINRAREGLRSYYASPEVIKQVERAGRRVSGPAYFADLYNSNLEIRPQARLMSAVVGAVALGLTERAAHAYGTLASCYTPQAVRTEVIDGLRGALEWEQVEGSHVRIGNLAEAIKVLEGRQQAAEFAGGTVLAQPE